MGDSISKFFEIKNVTALSAENHDVFNSKLKTNLPDYFITIITETNNVYPENLKCGIEFCLHFNSKIVEDNNVFKFLIKPRPLITLLSPIYGDSAITEILKKTSNSTNIWYNNQKILLQLKSYFDDLIKIYELEKESLQCSNVVDKKNLNLL